MRVFVTGGTGAIGSYAVPALVAAGHAVSALARTRQSSRSTCQGGEPGLGVTVRPCRPSPRRSPATTPWSTSPRHCHRHSV